jgi:hypothetical protein
MCGNGRVDAMTGKCFICDQLPEFTYAGQSLQIAHRRRKLAEQLPRHVRSLRLALILALVELAADDAGLVQEIEQVVLLPFT